MCMEDQYSNYWQNIPSDESGLGNKLAKLLSCISNVVDVKVDCRPSSKDIGEVCSRFYGDVGFLESQIDLAFAVRSMSNNKIYLIGVELKYITSKKQGYMAIYEGIGQAVLYSWLGFDIFCLLLFFHPSYDKSKAKVTSDIIYNILKSDYGILNKLNFISIYAERDEDRYRLKVIQSYPYIIQIFSAYSWINSIMDSAEKFNIGFFWRYNDWMQRRECLKQALKMPVI